MSRTQFRDGQVVIPEDIRKAAHLRDGEELEAEITAVGILLRTPRPIDPSQAWFWTPEWQAGEQEADEEIRAGRTTYFKNDEAFLAALEGLRAKNDADV